MFYTEIYINYWQSVVKSSYIKFRPPTLNPMTEILINTEISSCRIMYILNVDCNPITYIYLSNKQLILCLLVL